MYFDRFDICEAFSLLAHDYGLYDMYVRLNRLGFKASGSSEFYEGLTENGQAIYNHNAGLLDVGVSPIKSEFK